MEQPNIPNAAEAAPVKPKSLTSGEILSRVATAIAVSAPNVLNTVIEALKAKEAAKTQLSMPSLLLAETS